VNKNICKDQQLYPWVNVVTKALIALIPFYKRNWDEQKRKMKGKVIRKNISSVFFLLKSKHRVWIYTSNRLIIGLAKDKI